MNVVNVDNVVNNLNVVKREQSKFFRKTDFEGRMDLVKFGTFSHKLSTFAKSQF